MKVQIQNKKVLGITALSLVALGLSAQISFTNANSVLHSETGVLGSNANVRSGNSVAITDVNFDGLDDLVKLDGNRYVRIEYQQVGGTFTHVNVGDFGTSVNGWSITMADVDHNGYKDILYGGWGTGGARLMKLNSTGTGMMGTVTTLPGVGASISSQNVNFMDANNDGWEDIFVCNDVNESAIWLNDGTGNYPSQNPNGAFINFNVTPGTTAPNDESGNYGSVWTDFDNDGDVDLYIAHCRQGMAVGDLRRTNVLFENNNNTSYTSNAAAYNLASNDQDWTASFGDIDNDGDFDLFMTKHDVVSRYYINDGTGHFTISPNTIAFGNMPMQSQYEDLDNDGFVDLIITGDNDHRIYRNNGDGTFTNATPSNLTASGNTALSFASGDLNHDGKIDLYFSYGSTYNNPGSIDDIYWKNTTNNGNHFITLNLSASTSNKSCLGARAFIYGAWGTQTREVRASESYGTLNSSQLHFGLGTATSIDSIVVNWPSGDTNLIVNPQVDQFLTVSESGQCALSSVVITPTGSTNICNGQTVTLNAPTGSGYTYLWSNGATTQSITVSTAGSYAVQVTQSAGCVSISPSIDVTNGANETPTVSASQSNLIFCQGSNVTLSSTPASSYQWYLNGNAINGATSQSIVPTQTGNYAVQIQGACQTWTSTATSVTVNPSPATPTGANVYITAPQSVTLTATGNNLYWFDAPVGGTQLATGNNYVTPVVTVDTTFYVESQSSYGGANVFGGMKFHSGTGTTANFSGNTTNASLIFDVLAPCTLNTVKIYADQPGNRLIELKNSAGTVINSLMANIPVATPGTIDSTVVTLNFPLAVGTGYQLGTNTAQNQTLLGTASPRLRRSNANVSYPYAISNLVNINNSTQGGTVYYYFYDWNVIDAPMVCPSPRHPQSVLFNTLGVNNAQSDIFDIFPNPASTSVTIKMKSTSDKTSNISLVDMTGKTVYNTSIGPVKKGELVGLDISKISAGIYFLNFHQNGVLTVRKIIIE
ncbi:MAG: FG-GAP-like repeat-containing protein [Bacteroidota bacterium]|jgi:hypothetical protein